MTDQAERLRDLAAGTHPPGGGGETRVITVSSGKGGVGKTNLAVNLAIALQARGVRAGVLDGDLGLANVDIVLGVVPPFHLGHVLAGEKRLEEILLEGPGGIRVLAGGSGIHDLADLPSTQLEAFLGSLASLDLALDVLILDTGAGVGANVLAFVLAAREVIVVTTPDPTAITDAYGLVKLVARRSPGTRVLLVVNQVRDPKEGEEVFLRLERVTARFLQARVELLGSLPADGSVARAVREQRPFVLSYPHSPAAHSVAQMAAKLVGESPARGHDGVGALFRRVARLVGEWKG